MTQVVTVAPAGIEPDNSNARQNDHHKSNLGLIVGLAVGIPVALILLAAILFFSAHKMRQSNKYHTVPLKKKPSLVEANYANISPGTYAPEADSFPVAPGRTKSGRKSELYGSDVVLHSPTTSISTNGSVAPPYSPGGRTEPMTQIQEEPQELWGASQTHDWNETRYVAYRPPGNEQPQTGGAEQSR